MVPPGRVVRVAWVDVWRKRRYGRIADYKKRIANEMKIPVTACLALLVIVGLSIWPEQEAEAEVVCRDAILAWSWDLMAWICLDSNGPG
jgi:hypothetical protein